MTRIALLCLALALSPATLAAQETPSEGDSLMKRGFDMFLEGLEEEMGEVFRDLQDQAGSAAPALRDFFTRMGPALADLMEQVEDWSRYEPPVMLPNGDILIRRKPDPAPEPAPDAPPSDPVDI